MKNATDASQDKSTNETQPVDSDVSEEAAHSRRLPAAFRSTRSVLGASGAAVVLLIGLMTFTGQFDTLAQSVFQRLSAAAPDDATEESSAAEAPTSVFTRSDLPLHPDQVFRPYLAGPIFTSGVSETRANRIQRFRAFLDTYVQSRARDGNFTIRVLDDRTGEVLEVYVLDEAKARWKREGRPLDYDWWQVDERRGEATDRLVEKYEARGVPIEAITVRWGRRQQIRAAHQRALPYLEYEIALARQFGLSLLPTAFSIQETFNLDELESTAGARSRYQMMPYVLRRHDINQYTLSTPSGQSVQVREEWHPLLTMEASFITLAGYANAVGHEIPGLSAYHAGPVNIYRLYRAFLTHETEDFSGATTVMDAYMWGVTDGFEIVAANSTFGPYSRAYVASIYGMFKGADDLPINPAKTLRADRLRLETGRSILLSELLDVLGAAGRQMDWGPFVPQASLYERFRRMNPHLDLPPGEGPDVPAAGNIRLVAAVDGEPVRFFLPPAADTLLRRKGYDLFDEEATFTFNRRTYTDPRGKGKTLWDRMYDDLVADIAHFGFTPENHERLLALQERFAQMAEEHPTHYRKMQLQIINTHARLWSWGPFDKLVATTEAVMGERRAPVLPPVRLAPSHILPPQHIQQ